MYSVLIDDCRKPSTPTATERTIKPCSIDIAVVRGSTLAGWLQRRRESSAVTTQTMILDGPFAETKG